MGILLFWTDTYTPPTGDNQYADGSYGTGVYAQLGDTIVEPPPVDPIVILPRPAFKPPLELHAEVITADGVRYRWSDERRDPGQILSNVSFASKRFEGYERGGGSLARPIDRDWPDLNLYDTFSLIGYDASVAYEGRVQGIPRSSPYGIDIETTGWMAHARDRKFREIYRDADLSRWGEAGTSRRAQFLDDARKGVLAQWATSASADPKGVASLLHEATRLVSDSGQYGVAESWYDAQGIPLRELWTDVLSKGLAGASPDLNWNQIAFLSSDQLQTQVDSSTDLNGVDGPNQIQVLASGHNRSWALLQTLYGGTFTGDGTWTVFHRRPVVYGDHTVPKRGTEPDAGVYASDVMIDIASRFCPRLDTSEVRGTTHPIGHLVFLDRADPYDAWLELNKYHLWQELAVWEARKLHYAPIDMGDYDWEVRLSDPGTKVELQGDSTDHLANYAVVRFTNVRTGREEEIGPDQYPELRDWAAENPANRHGLDVEFGIQLSDLTDPDSAAQIGRAALAENNQPIAPGTITFSGHIRDRAGHWQPGWKVKGGKHRVAISDFPNNRPRAIVEFSWDQGSKVGTIGVDATLNRVDATLDRYGTALRAAGISN